MNFINKFVTKERRKLFTVNATPTINPANIFENVNSLELNKVQEGVNPNIINGGKLANFGLIKRTYFKIICKLYNNMNKD